SAGPDAGRAWLRLRQSHGRARSRRPAYRAPLHRRSDLRSAYRRGGRRHGRAAYRHDGAGAYGAVRGTRQFSAACSAALHLRRRVESALSMVGGIRGWLALAPVASADLFGSMSGSSVGCVAAIGRLMVPELSHRGYTKVFSGSLIASCGAIATIIPPSITMIIYGIAAQQSVPKLFLAGIVPGLLIGALFSFYLLTYPPF